VEQAHDAHRRVLQHVGHDEEPNHASTNVNLIELGDTTIALCDRDIPKGDVEVVFS
jgi:hypothetical protein